MKFENPLFSTEQTASVYKYFTRYAQVNLTHNLDSIYASSFNQKCRILITYLGSEDDNAKLILIEDKARLGAEIASRVKQAKLEYIKFILNALNDNEEGITDKLFKKNLISKPEVDITSVLAMRFSEIVFGRGISNRSAYELFGDPDRTAKTETVITDIHHISISAREVYEEVMMQANKEKASYARRYKDFYKSQVKLRGE